MSEAAKTVCPACREPVRSKWKFCPACETLLGAFLCPQCRQPVKENWKRCPECEARLVCINCSRRIPAGASGCSVCAGSVDPQETLEEPVTGMSFAHVPGGTFQMGDTFNEGVENEQPVHAVRLSPFYIGRYPVTQAQWNRLMPDNPSHHPGDSLPVEQVAWGDVHAFVHRLTEAGSGRYEFCLPTEAQWEFAARSRGKEEMYAGGNVADPVAWFDENSDGMTHPVGTKAPNGLGLFDMSGNVWEWCRDTFRADAYRRHPAENPVITDGGRDRVIRGGSWNIDAWSVRCARRFSFPPEYYGAGLGFRLVLFRKDR